MENASKALIMAGAILIAIMIVSLGIVVFNNMSNSAKQAANMDKQEIESFNAKITPYVGQNINGSQVNALIQLIISIDNSAINSGDTLKTVSITYPLEAGGNNTIEVSGNTINGINAVKRVRTGAGVYYNVSAEYNENGLINKITVN